MKENICTIYDTTLRDGLQENGREISLFDAVKFAKKLDDIGFPYIEAGFAGAGANHLKRIKALTTLKLKNAKVVAFGRSRGKNEKVEVAKDLAAILDSGARVAAVVGKVRKRDVEISLRATPAQNLLMIGESVAFLKKKGLEVIFDAEHYFDGILDDQEYTLKAIKTAYDSGAECVVLCDTNGGADSELIKLGIELAAMKIPLDHLGFHEHNDRGRAVANSELAFSLGVRHIQGTINGYGERCGNTDLCQLIPNLIFDHEASILKPIKLTELSQLSAMTAEFLNADQRSNQPWVGSRAGYTEAGMHTSGMLRDPESYIHADLAKVGNKISFGVSEQSGKSNIVLKTKELGFDLIDKELANLVNLHNEKIKSGYVYAGADASFLLLILEILKEKNKFEPFRVNFWRVIASKSGQNVITDATISYGLGTSELAEIGNGDGPVDALNNAANKIIKKLYPKLKEFRLDDYRVRIVNPTASSAAKVRVVIESTDGTNHWATVGVDENIIQASWQALEDSINYFLYKSCK